MPTADAWYPEHPAIWMERAAGESRVIALRHPSHPYEVDAAADDSASLIEIAAGYLRRIEGLFELPELLEPSGTQFTVPMVWLPVHGDDTAAPPRASFWVRRYEPYSTQLVDRSVVILAVQCAVANDERSTLNSRLGIRIVAHVSRGPAPFGVRITSAACSSGLAKALVMVHTEVVKQFFDAFFGPPQLRADLRSGIRQALGMGADAEVWMDGLRVVGVSGARAILDVYATVPRPQDEPDTPSFAVTARLAVEGAERPRVLTLRKWPLVAHAGPVRPRLFPYDPASLAGPGNLVESRPNRSPERLEKYRRQRTLPGLTLSVGGEATLLDDLDQVQVTRSKLLDPGANETVEETVRPAAVTHARRNEFAALSGYQRGRGLSDTMRGYGLSPVEYFKFALLPLRIRYRASIKPGQGKDGKTVNAQVNFDPPRNDLVVADPLNLEPIQVRFALADLKRSVSRREPLGLAADPRWSWHEYGHVLLVASTGALQFRFAHSAGDALAAVLSDPASRLATNPRLRGLTFPWVYLHRRHDRDVFRGWSWSGRFHRPAAFTTDPNSYPRKGYQSEQILSTSLFRLYRVLGGDTIRSGGAPARPRRRAAAHYTAYLVMKAIGLMPPAFGAPLETPDQLVTALIDADIETQPVATGPLRGRVGGWAHKVVRWAFEAQGLYASNDPLAVADRPGVPPDPDIFIDDRRPSSAGARPRGGYMPVSLHWRATPNPSRWHARASAIRVNGNDVTVRVRNRGASAATGVTVQVWWIVWPAAQPAPLWDKATWSSLPMSVPDTVDPWPGSRVFGPFALPPQPAGQRLLIVAEATCPADRANTDPASGLPCAIQPTPLVDVIAGDNNLGLRLHVT